ncbi:MAG: YIP1 family protein [Bacillota bacterium]
MKKIFCIVFLVLIVLFTIHSVGFTNSYNEKSYIYDYYGNAVPAPVSYKTSRSINNYELRDVLEKPMENLRDIFIRKDKIYIVDGGNERIIIFDKQWELLNIINEFENNGVKDSFKDPRGIFITSEEQIFVADKGNKRIVTLNSDGSFVREYTGPDSEETVAIKEEDYNFNVEQMVVTPRLEQMIVVVSGEYNGLLEFDLEGNFQGFIGAPEVDLSVEEYFWHRFATQEQKERMKRFIPTEFNNITTDKKGLIYGVEAGEISEETIKMLNPSGQDQLVRQGIHPPVGDIYKGGDVGEDNGGAGSYKSAAEAQRFIDITVRNYNMISVLEKNFGRIFTYNQKGELLYIFGKKGIESGSFKDPVAIESYEDKIYIMEGDPPRINVFEPTQYSSYIHQAIKNYDEGRYEIAAELWEKVLERNLNLEMAHIGLGRQYLRENNLEKALEMFRLGQDRENYSKVFNEYRQNIIRENTHIVFYVFLTVILLIILFFKIPKYLNNVYSNINEAIADYPLVQRSFNILSNMLKDFRNVFYVIFHPFSGFWELKHEGKGKYYVALILLGLVSGSYVILRQYTAFVFNTRNVQEINIYREIISVLIPFVLWCITNWGFTTLTDGKGSIGDIFIASAYALTPIFLINIPMTAISHYLTLEEAQFYNLFLVFSIIWSMILLFSGTLVTHDYTFSKNLFSIIVTIVGMGTLLFIFMLYFSVVGRLMGFIISIINEVTLRA